MSARPKDIGTAAETAVVRALRQLGFPHAERRALAGAFDLGDIVGTPGIVWEVKGGNAAKTASDGQVFQWVEETERERRNAGADIGILVMQRSGIGAGNAHRWLAVTRLHHLVPRGTRVVQIPVRTTLDQICLQLRYLGYGTPTDEAP